MIAKNGVYKGKVFYKVKCNKCNCSMGSPRPEDLKQEKHFCSEGCRMMSERKIRTVQYHGKSKKV